MSVTATVLVRGSSFEQPGGSVDIGLRVRNDGSDPIRVIGVSSRASGFAIRDVDNAHPDLVRPGKAGLVPLSVGLDCATHTAYRYVLPIQLTVRSVHGVLHRRTERADAAALVVVADNLCSNDSREYPELSGPVLKIARDVEDLGYH